MGSQYGQMTSSGADQGLAMFVNGVLGLAGGTLLGAFGYPWMVGRYARGVDTRIGPEHWRIENAATPEP